MLPHLVGQPGFAVVEMVVQVVVENIKKVNKRHGRRI